MPADFSIILVQLGSQQTAKHFRASLTTVTLWRRQAGLPLHHRAKKPSRSTARPMQGRLGGGPRPLFIHRDRSRAGQAAEFLQRNGPIYRCTSNAVPFAKGAFWNRGGRVLTDADVIERATRLGWQPEQL